MGEYPTTRADWRVRAAATLDAIQGSTRFASEEILADALAEAYEAGGGGDCIHGTQCSECNE